MAEQQQDLLAQLSELLHKTQTPAPGATWDASQGEAGIQGVNVPIKITRAGASLRLYLQLGPGAASSPQALHAALDKLEQLGLALDLWEPKAAGGGWNSSGHYPGRRGW